MELRILGIPRVPAAQHRIEPQLQPPKRARTLPEINEWCSLIADRIQSAKHRALHLKEMFHWELLECRGPKITRMTKIQPVMVWDEKEEWG